MFKTSKNHYYFFSFRGVLHLSFLWNCLSNHVLSIWYEKLLSTNIMMWQDLKDYSYKDLMSDRRASVTNQMWLTRSVGLVLYDNGHLFYLCTCDKRLCSVLKIIQCHCSRICSLRVHGTVRVHFYPAGLIYGYAFRLDGTVSIHVCSSRL